MLRKAVLAFSLVLGFGSLTWPSAADADTQQTGKVWRIGFLSTAALPDPDFARNWETLRQTLQDLGYAEGKNLVFERRFAEGRLERFPAFASELVRLNVDAIVVTSSAAAHAAADATTAIPIVMLTGGDPMRGRLAAEPRAPRRQGHWGRRLYIGPRPQTPRTA